MDARSLRSRARLHAAVLELAGEHPVDEVSATAVCRAAGLTRDTFYRHAENPLALLADALGEELDALRADLDDIGELRDAERRLLQHVRDRAAVYRGAMRPSLAAPLRSRLQRELEAGLAAWTDRHPSIVPTGLAADAGGLRMAIAYAASGTVGAIEEWLRQGDLDVERGLENVLAASPSWWLG